MPTHTRKSKECCASRGSFTPEQANDIIDAFFEVGDPVITKSVLRAEMNRLNVRLLLGVAAINGMYLAAAALL